MKRSHDFDGNTYRAVYTARFGTVVYVLDVFVKKSKSGIATSKVDNDRVKERFKAARANRQILAKRGMTQRSVAKTLGLAASAVTEDRPRVARSRRGKSPYVPDFLSGEAKVGGRPAYVIVR